MTFTVRPAANDDMREALAWLVRRKRYSAVTGLYDEFEAGLERIAATPRAHPPAEDGPPGGEFRNYLTRRYGYRMVFEVTPTEVIVLAVIRGARRPGFWNSRRPAPNPTDQP